LEAVRPHIFLDFQGLFHFFSPFPLIFQRFFEPLDFMQIRPKMGHFFSI